MMMNAANDLRQLYRSARRMAASDDVDVLLGCLLEDMVTSTNFERILLLKVEHSDLSLVVEKCYGFEDALSVPSVLPISADTGLLHLVYSEQEPLNMVQAGTRQISNGTAAPGEDNNEPSDDLLNADFSHNRTYQQYSVTQYDGHDKNLSMLLGNSTSFLILPICDQDHFYGFMIADKAKSGTTISYDEIRQSSALASHSANALCRACKYKQMLTKITGQLLEIEQLESFSQSIMQNLRSGLIIVNQLMNITELNRAAELALGYSADELLGKPIDYLLEDRYNRQECLFIDESDQLDSSMGLLAETLMHTKNGKSFPAEMCYSVITDKRGEIQGLSCIFRDITARKNMERDLARVDKLTSLGELAAGIAHEIKNPLAGIAGAIQIISKSCDKESPHRVIFNEVLSQVNRLDSFVNGLLKFARPGQTNFSTVDPASIVDKALFVVASQLDDKDITIRKKIGQNPPLIQGDADQLQQVFLNILLNAIDATGSRGKIIIETSWQFYQGSFSKPDRCSRIPHDKDFSGQFTVAIIDNGKGIDSQKLETIFNPFHTTKSNGTGLGLSISQRIMEQHSGSISVKSSPNQGATFSVSLPFYAAC